MKLCRSQVFFFNFIFNIFSTNLYPISFQFNFNSIVIQLLNWNSIQIVLNVFESNIRIWIWIWIQIQFNLHACPKWNLIPHSTMGHYVVFLPIWPSGPRSVQDALSPSMAGSRRVIGMTDEGELFLVSNTLRVSDLGIWLDSQVHSCQKWQDSYKNCIFCSCFINLSSTFLSFFSHNPTCFDGQGLVVGYSLQVKFNYGCLSANIFKFLFVYCMYVALSMPSGFSQLQKKVGYMSLTPHMMSMYRLIYLRAWGLITWILLFIQSKLKVLWWCPCCQVGMSWSMCCQ
jgi:hypothetical protein